MRRALAALVCVAVANSAARAQDTTSTDSTRATASPAVQINGLLQLWYLDGHTVTNAHDTYRLRRADLKLSGAISPRVRWRLSFDAAKLLNLTKTSTGSGDSSVVRDVAVDQRGRLLQEASVNVTLSPFLRLDVGQQIIPLGLEGVIPSALIETIERTMFIAERTRGAGIADVRDIGASLRGTVAAGSVDYQLGLFNEMGESQNAVDQNDQKAVLGRLAIRIPGATSLQIGGSGGFEGGPPPQHRERAGAEVQFKRSRITLRSEVMTARDGLARKLGYYALGVVRPTPVVDVVARFDDWDPDLHLESGAADAHERQIVAGANYYVDGGSTRVAANLVHASFPSHLVAASTLLLLSLQVLW